MSIFSLIRLPLIRRTTSAKKNGTRLAMTAAMGVLWYLVASGWGGGEQPVKMASVMAQASDTTPTPTETATKEATETATSGPTSTPLPTATNTPTPSKTPFPAAWDHLEPNNALDTAVTIPVNHTEKGLTLHNDANRPDVDYFAIYGKKGQIIIATTFVSVGTDTRMSLYAADGTLLSENDDRSPTDLSSAIGWVVDRDRWYTVKVESSVPGQFGEYDLSVMLGAPTPTATTAPPEPTGTPVPAPVATDSQEPNDHIAQAKDIVGNTSYELTLPKGDIDVFRFHVERGAHYRCDANPNGVDTILYIKEQDGSVIAENDNRSVADIGSSVEWTASDTGFVYVQAQALIGEGSYAFVCTGVEPTPRPSGGNGGGINITPPDPTTTPTTLATPVRLSVRFVSQLPPPTATAEVMTTFRLHVAYDADGNKQGNPDEGIANVSARAVLGGQIKKWSLTDEWGEAVLVIRGNVDRVIIPLLGWDSSVKPGQETSATVIIPPVNLPVVIPVVTPESD